jgi:hypothetical protein
MVLSARATGYEGWRANAEERRQSQLTLAVEAV